MPKDEPPLSAAELALIRRWIDQGARDRRRRRRRRRPGKRRSRSMRPAVPAVGLGRRGTAPLDRFVAPISRSGARRRTRARVRRAVRAARLSRHLGPAADAGGAAGVPRRPGAREARARSSRRCSPTTRSTPITGSRSGTICCATRTASRYFSETAGRKSITDWLLAGARRSNLPYDQFVTQAAQSVDARRSRRLPRRRQLARRDERRGHAVDAGVAEHRAGVPRRQPEVQLLPRQLRQQVEAEGRVRARRLLLARAEAAAVSLRRRAGRVRRARRSSFPSWRARRRPARWPTAAPRPRRSSPIRASAASRARSSTASGSASSATASSRNPDEMDGKPWSPELLDWLASDFVEHGYDVKHLIATILTSRAYQMPAVPRERASRRPAATCSRGPEVRRLTAEQFADAIGSITGEWNAYPGAGAGGRSDAATRQSAAVDAADGGRLRRASGASPSTNLTRALGRPIRDQVIPVRAAQASTLQALELVNGEILTRWLSRGARRMLGETAAGDLEPLQPDRRRTRRQAGTVRRRRLEAQHACGSSCRRTARTCRARCCRRGRRRSSSGLPAPSRCRRSRRWTARAFVPETGPIEVGGATGAGVRVQNPSVVAYDIAGKGFTSFRGVIGLENPPRRNRLDPRPADQVLRLRCATGHGPVDSATPGGSIAGAAHGELGVRGGRPCVPPRSRARAVGRRARRRRSGAS